MERQAHDTHTSKLKFSYWTIYEYTQAKQLLISFLKLKSFNFRNNILTVRAYGHNPV